MPPHRLALFTTHPVQYHVPWYRALAQDASLDLTVYYASRRGVEVALDPMFRRAFAWDLPLLDGYRYEFLPNRARRPNVETYRGCDTPIVGRLLAQKQFDAAIVWGWYTRSAWQAYRGCWRTGTPYLVRGESVLFVDRPWYVRALKRLVLKRLFARAAAFLAIGTRNTEFYLDYGVPRGKLFSAPYCVDNDYFACRAAAVRARRDEVRRELGIRPDAFVFLFCGRFFGRKRPELAIRAVTLLPPSLNVALIAVGDGPSHAECRALAAGSPHPVVLPGFMNQSQVPQFYAISDALLVPSDWETWGLVVNEAFACGLPAIVTDRVGCAPDLIVEGVTGYVVRRGEAAALAAAMRVLAEDRERAGRMGAAAAQRASDFTIARSARSAAEAVAWVCEQRQ